MAQLIKADGSTQKIELPINNQLKTLQTLVGGNIEIVNSTEEKFLIICDEEGKLKQKRINYKATMLYWHTSDPLAGDVLICNKNEIE